MKQRERGARLLLQLESPLDGELRPLGQISGDQDVCDARHVVLLLLHDARWSGCARVLTRLYCRTTATRALQKLADETELTLHVHHYPPRTSKWNKIEPRLFCHIAQNCRPLTDRLAVVELIGATTTKAGLKVDCVLDERAYEKGIKVSDAEMRELGIIGDPLHPEWNSTIKPRRR
jgi:hypothetical protein